MDNWISALLWFALALAAAWLALRLVRGRFRYAVAAALGLFALLAGCSLYHRRYDVPPPVPNAPYEFHVVQSDDFGSFWDLDAAQAALDSVKDKAATRNVIVVLFIHGWHHNADSEQDSNLADFRGSLDEIAKELSSPPYRQAREFLTGDPEFDLVGIYVGWRGRSLPGALDYGTMWWRKEAAERVGSGDVSEFLTRLQLQYDRANAFDPASGQDPRRHFMGLVSIGHSFGGQVLLKSVAPRLEAQLAAVTPRLAHTSGKARAAELRTEVAPISGLGDLNVLLNPAAEAYQFARIDDLYRSRSYPPAQTPQLVVFSADDDWARKTFFPIARGLAAPFRARFRDESQARQWSRALGELEEQRTHALRLSDEPDTFDAGVYDDPDRLRAHDFTAHTVFSGVALDPAEGPSPVANSPVAIVYTHQDIIQEHNGIFGARFRDFLSKYVAYTEGKRLVARFDDRRERLKVYRLRQAAGTPGIPD